MKPAAAYLASDNKTGDMFAVGVVDAREYF